MERDHLYNKHKENNINLTLNLQNLKEVKEDKHLNVIKIYKREIDDFAK